jgi:CheY-like chemotaxis protein
MDTISSVRFLLIDDDQINNFICESILRLCAAGAPVIAFTNPQLAVDYIKDNYPLAEGVKTILLLDINMPVLNGWDVLDKLKDMKLGNFVTYMLTSSIDLKDKEKAENNLLVSGFIEKPLDLEPFSALIKQNME